MKIQYQLKEKDYHTQLLYIVSQNNTITQTRVKVRLLLTISLIIFAIIAYGNEAKGQTIYFLVLAILVFIFTPLFTRWSYQKSFLKQVKKYYHDRLSMPTQIIFLTNEFEITDNHGEAKISAQEIERFIEINNYIFLLLKVGTSVIIPIYQIENQEEVVFEMRKLSINNDIEWKEELNWKWK